MGIGAPSPPISLSTWLEAHGGEKETGQIGADKS